MAVPKKRTSKAKKGTRRAHDHVSMPNVSSCPQCHEPVLSHHICPSCGTYRGKTVIQKEEA
jgi:large subunit ribosomal protein L32